MQSLCFKNTAKIMGVGKIVQREYVCEKEEQRT